MRTSRLTFRISEPGPTRACRRILRILVTALAIVAVLDVSNAQAAQKGTTPPRAELRAAPLIELTGQVDSNNPALWDRVGGRDLLFVMTSFNGQPRMGTRPHHPWCCPASDDRSSDRRHLDGSHPSGR